ncbi:tripartite tricarboxylate transporter substrate binding protein [Delftia tsuruhatensis]|jgi:tripartite-type tricarboxylate transporter receptor subunit TctC|uniref:tripartite tricarboxylate transporter substrate binding protein n=1 Tax=Delftia TaxID=80865 RepID=UPI000925B11F|nr:MULTISPECIES: tripartite tricarboxylate transporter substrate binding protein [Delftia]MDH0417915.1 tripartite tricarboxylate transporter substrate binding protein [Delftia tsuruhatensis]MDH0771858.1 tripartite tricarboxylate transporter substrate binding protein [Delftia tsuruhatensis]MDH1456623.1 tripartite tricarboxylate transporter substrate binding protein [Delftia tsuruhatensis]MDH1822641.1 tripartite tricarboxylate transporter substrate binding protein [Delftia tsuruhatensis]MDR67278
MTTASRRHFIRSLGALAAAPVLPAVAQAPAGAWPQRPIELIVPFAAGGGTDVLARALAEVARKHLPQDLIVLNRAGASGAVGWTELANARPDGYKIGIITVELTMIPHMGLTKISSDALLPVARLNADPATIAVRADSPYRSIEELIAAARKDEAAVRIGNAGPGSLGHLAAAALQDKAGVKFNHAPYRGANPAVLDLLGGHIEAVAVTPVEVATYVAAGKIRPLAIMAEQRIQAGWEAVPTLKERGIDLLIGGWRGLAVPRNTPDAVVQTLRKAMTQTLKDPVLRETMAKQNMGEGYLDQPEFKAVIDRDNAVFKQLVDKLGIKA